MNNEEISSAAGDLIDFYAAMDQNGSAATRSLNLVFDATQYQHKEGKWVARERSTRPGGSIGPTYRKQPG
jgi:hypothetical protein